MLFDFTDQDVKLPYTVSGNPRNEFLSRERWAIIVLRSRMNNL